MTFCNCTVNQIFKNMNFINNAIYPERNSIFEVLILPVEGEDSQHKFHGTIFCQTPQ
jgi:hypothetical protein